MFGRGAAEELGEVRESRVPVIPDRLRLPLLILVIALCSALFVVAVLYGLTH